MFQSFKNAKYKSMDLGVPFSLVKKIPTKGDSFR